MNTRAIKYEISRADKACAGSSVYISDIPQLFKQAVSSDNPVIYVVSNESKDLLLVFKDVIIDIGSKGPKIELKRKFLNRDKMPFLQGDYASPGKVESSIRPFIKRVYKQSRNENEVRVFFLGIPKSVFERLWEQITGAIVKGKYTARAKIEPPIAAVSVQEDASADSSCYYSGDADNKKIRLEDHYKGESEQAKKIRQRIVNLAKYHEPVLLLGETGTGKGVVAGCIHNQSTRRAKPFLTINCSAIAYGLFESELFGHKKGAFTDAKFDRKGLWEAASGGTLFLDEIGDLPPEHQAKILDVIERNRVRPVGGTKEITVDLRIIAATNRELYAMVQAGTFRADLYYRLRGSMIRMPPLREQPDNIAYLARELWRDTVIKDRNAQLPNEIIRELMKHKWRGNVRELRAVLLDLFNTFGKKNIGAKHIEEIFRSIEESEVAKDTPISVEEIDLHRVECLRHLKHSEEWIQACQIMFEPFVIQKTSISEQHFKIMRTLQERLQELETITVHPLLFYSETTFSAINELKGKLIYFQGLLKERIFEQAQHFLQHDLQKQLKKSLGALFKAVDSLLKK